MIQRPLVTVSESYVTHYSHPVKRALCAPYRVPNIIVKLIAGREN